MRISAETNDIICTLGYGILNVALVCVFLKAMKNSFVAFALTVNGLLVELMMGMYSILTYLR